MMQWLEPSAPPMPAALVLGGGDAAARVDAGIRVRRAKLADVAAVTELLEAYARRGLVLPRTYAQLCRLVREFVVAVDDEGVVGCAALRIYTPALGELAALAVAEGCQGKGVGGMLVETIVEEARAFALGRVFAMTRQEPFFHRLGFRAVALETIPEKVAADRVEGIDRSLCAKTAMIRVLVPGRGTD